MKITRKIKSGILFMLAAAVCFAVMVLCVKLLNRTYPSQEIVFFRSILGVVMTSTILRIKNISMWGHAEARLVLVLRGLSGYVALAMSYYAITHLSLGMGTLLNYTAPVFSALLAVFFLKERPNAALIILTLVAFAGIDLLVQSEPDFSKSPAIALGLLSAVFAAVAYVSIRKLKHHVSPLTVIFYFTLISTLGSGFFCSAQWQIPRFQDIPILAVVGIVSFLGQLWLTISLRRAPASIAVPFSYLTAVLSYLLGFIFLHEIPATRALAGTVIVIVAGSLIPSLGHAHESSKNS